MTKDYFSSYDHVQVYGDGDKLRACFHDFENLQESPAGFGNTDAEAIAELAHAVRTEQAAEINRLKARIAEFEAGHPSFPDGEIAQFVAECTRIIIDEIKEYGVEGTINVAYVMDMLGDLVAQTRAMRQRAALRKQVQADLQRAGIDLTKAKTRLAEVIKHWPSDNAAEQKGAGE